MSFRLPIAIILVLLLATTSVVQADEIYLPLSLNSVDSVSASARQEKVAVCHLDDDGVYVRIDVAAPALPAHIAHGDAVVGVDLDENCEPLYRRPAKTGQTECWDESGFLIDCSGTGQDGEYQYGDEPAVEPASGYDFGGYDRTTILAETDDPGFTDNDDGTVTDELTGLTWLQDANCFGIRTWQAALDAANGLANGACSLTDNSTAGEWRLPNINELRSLFDRTEASPYLPAEHPFIGVQSLNYWSSTSRAGSPLGAWYVLLFGGSVSHDVKDGGGEGGYYVWPVRGGQ